jgi:hypothetical protein
MHAVTPWKKHATGDVEIVKISYLFHKSFPGLPNTREERFVPVKWLSQPSCSNILARTMNRLMRPRGSKILAAQDESDHIISA